MVNNLKLVRNNDEMVDMLEAAILEHLDTANCPVIHRFTLGLYIREIFMPAGSLITSKIHKTEHPYVVSQGVVSVWIDAENEVLIEAPFTGITKPNTRRVLYVHEDCIWTTFHPTDVQPESDSEEDILKAVGGIEDQIIEKHENKLLQNENKRRLQCHGLQ